MLAPRSFCETDQVAREGPEGQLQMRLINPALERQGHHTVDLPYLGTMLNA